MLQRVTGLLVATLLCAAGASAQESAAAFDPGKLKGPAKGSPNEVMVLGTAHLSQLPAAFQPASIAALNQRLLAWKLRIIAIENLSGPQCDFMRRYPHRYKDSVQSFCGWDPAPARAATGLDVPAATAEMDRLLASGPRTRRRPSGATLPPCSSPAANRSRRSCSGCACRRGSATPATASTPPWSPISAAGAASAARTR